MRVASDRTGSRGGRRPRRSSDRRGTDPVEEAPAPVAPKPKRRDPLWARLAVIFGALIMMASGGSIVAGRLLITSATADITTTNMIGGEAAVVGNNIDGAINMLLVGIDERPAGSPETAVLSDTIVILHVPATHDQAFLISIPRDTRAQIPPYPATNYPGSAEKINSAFGYGYRGEGTELQRRARGVDLLARTITRMSGIKFNAAALIDFVGFEAVVRELGGVNLCVDQKAESSHLGYDRNGKLLRLWSNDVGKVQGIPPGGRPVIHEVGCGRMSPELALDYSRIRYSLPNGDYDRQRHQQQLIKAIAKEATSKGVITDPAKLQRVISAAGKAFVLDTLGIPLADFIFTLKGVAANDLVLIRTNAGTFSGIEGTTFQQLNGESMAMLAAARDGTLLEFLAGHPHLIARS